MTSLPSVSKNYFRNNFFKKRVIFLWCHSFIGRGRLTRTVLRHKGPSDTKLYWFGIGITQKTIFSGLWGKKNNSGFSILHIMRFPREKWPVVGQKFDHRFVYKPRAVSVGEFVCFRELNILQPGAWLTNQQDAACCNCAPPPSHLITHLFLSLSLFLSPSLTLIIHIVDIRNVTRW